MAGVEAAAISAIVSVTLKNVVNKLAPLLIRTYSSIVGVKEDLEELHGLILEVDDWLETIAGNANASRVPFAWLQKLKDISYDVDDVVDEFQLKAEKHDSDGDGGIVSKYLCTIPKSFVFQCKAANKIKAIKKRFAAIVKQRTDYLAITNSLSVGPHVRPTNMRTNEAPALLPNVDEALVVGRDKDKQKIISMLQENDDQQKIKIVSVIGLGGSGKTTLAKLVFNDGKIIEKHFDLRLWVHVSQEFNVRNLIKKLFEAFSDNDPGPHALPYMTKTISDKLMGKRFLLVLDDIWTESRDEWEEFMVYIKGGAPKSRILLTTRNREVAVIVGSTDQFHLPFLSRDDSWQLFQQCLIIPTTGQNFEFEEVGKKIVDKCGGVPLAIKVLAGALHGKERIEEWQAIRDKKISIVNGKEDRVATCLRLSYFQLPNNLKQCFTICSVFPKGHRIDTEQLIDLWIAHDIIIPEDGFDYLNLEYVGHKHFTSLLQVSFLHNVEEKNGRLTCEMHDLVHDLALSIMGDQVSLHVPNEATNSTKSYRYFSFNNQPENVVRKNNFRKARAIYMPWWYGGMALKHAKHLRSVMVGYVDAKEANAIFQVKYLKYLAMSCDSEMLPKSISDVWSLQALHVTESSLAKIPESIGKLKMLRTLNLSGCGKLKSLPDSIGDCQMISSIDISNCKNLTVLPDSIGRNQKLRVLRLSFTKIERLPLIITRLRNLECLDLQGCCELVDLPEGIVNLEKLHVLNLKSCEKLVGMPVGIGQLSQLQKLGLFVVGNGEKFAGISELANVSRIGEELTIRGIAHVMEPIDAHRACLKLKRNLQKLDLQWLSNHQGEFNIYMENVLDDLEPPSMIEELKIHWYSGRKYARWMQNQVGGEVQGTAPFPFLRVMKLYNFPNLKNIHGLVELPCLEELDLKSMPSLESISGGPFPSLVKLKMYRLSCVGEVWMVTERTMPAGEEGGGCCNFTPQLGQVRVGNCLTKLEISYCPKLVVKPHLPPSLEHFWLRGSEQLLQSPRKCQGSSSSPSFSHLKKLESCCGLSSLPQSMGQLAYLQELVIGSCDALEQLPDCLGELCSLRKLEIRYMLGLTCLPQSVCHLTTSLQELEIAECPVITSLPQGIEGLLSLEKLSIMDCPGLTSLPQGMEGLVSLKKLTVWNCPGIQSLPEGIKGLTALKELWIYGCPDLERRCKEGTGEDGHLISHIPLVMV